MPNDIIARDAVKICERVNLAGLQGKTILVTGASGLLGTYFLATLAHLRETGVKLKVVAQVRSEPAAHTTEIIRRGGFQLARANVADHQECLSLPEADVVIHSAGYAQPLIFMANPAATIQVNTTATATLLQKLRPGGSFLFISSCEVYSGLNKSLVSESDIGTTTPLHPRSSYIEGKRCGEAICNAYRTQGVRAVSVRVALTYGPGTRKHDKRAMNSFIEQALCQGRIKLMDAGNAVRTCCYASDAVELMWQAALHGTQPVYNIGGHSVVSMGELAKLVGKITNVPVSFPATQAEVAGAPEEVRLDLTRPETEFQKNKYVSLEDGLHATIEWQRGLYAS
jgi:nucleoside-diphosphate-sugar epimerase